MEVALGLNEKPRKLHIQIYPSDTLGEVMAKVFLEIHSDDPHRLLKQPCVLGIITCASLGCSALTVTIQPILPSGNQSIISCCLPAFGELICPDLTPRNPLIECHPLFE